MAKLNKQPPAPPAPAPAPRPVDRGGQAAYSEDLPDDIGGQHRDRDPYPRIPACAPWWFVCVPDRWAVVEGHVIPHLYKLSNAPGANGVERSGSGKANPSLAIASVEAQGHIVLPRDIDGRNYLRSYQVGEAVDRKTGAPVKVLTWVSRWETLYNGSTSIESDGAGFASWVEGLVDAGKLPRPRPYVLERLRSFYADKLALAQVSRHQTKIQGYQRDLDAVLAAIQRYAPERSPAPIEDADPESAGEAV